MIENERINDDGDDDDDDDDSDGDDSDICKGHNIERNAKLNSTAMILEWESCCKTA